MRKFILPAVAVAFLLLALFVVPVSAAPTLIAFKSHSCAPCAKMEPTLRSLERDGYRVIRVYTDTPQGEALARRYQVDSVPTYLVLKRDGSVAARHEGPAPKGKLLTMFKIARIVVKGLIWLLL